MTRKETELKKEQGQYFLVQTQEKEEQQFIIFILWEKIKCIVKIQGEQLKLFCLPIRKAL